MNEPTDQYLEELRKEAIRERNRFDHAGESLRAAALTYAQCRANRINAEERYRAALREAGEDRVLSDTEL